MKDIFPNLFVGSDIDCSQINSNFACIHACKTCHQTGVGYRGNLPSSHLNYLIYENGIHLYLNMVDMDRELMPKFTHPIMKCAIIFIEKYLHERNILIHCNQGQSRSPAIGLLYLARHEIVDNSSYSSAKTAFSLLYPQFNPGLGIELYLNRNWKDVLAL